MQAGSLFPCTALVVVAALGATTDRSNAAMSRLPWAESGLTERQAAAHLLNRLTFGPRPGDVDRVVAVGLEAWLEEQLAAAHPDSELAAHLESLRSLDLETRSYPEVYPNPGRVLQEAREAGVIPESLDVRQVEDGRARRQLRRKIVTWAQAQGYRSQRELFGELMTQKLYRAVYAENQLAEVLTDFWFNHFNVSLTDNQARVFVPSFERDAIRPYVLGDFRAMLSSTARHPAMLLYLDNAQSTASRGEITTLDNYRDQMQRSRGRRGVRSAVRGTSQNQTQRQRSQGLNENYARELLELHTLGVDGGYSQQDVVEVARAFSGWTIYPPRALQEELGSRLDRALASGAGFVAEEGFLFRADAHDAGKKSVLGRTLPAGRGIEDGEDVLELVASHPSTGRHVAAKLAARFVADEPPESLVEHLTVTYRRSGGDIRRLMEALVSSPEFWSLEARRQKIKSPFELTASALRGLDAEIVRPRETLEWISRMGQPLYAYQAPTGYPDHAEFWVNSGALLQRMNFGLELAAGKIDGVKLDLLALNNGEEPESRLEALQTYFSLLLPERDSTETSMLLEPMVLEPALSDKVGEAAPEVGTASGIFAVGEELLMEGAEPNRRPERGGRYSEPTALQLVVGVILGSPEFQRR